MSYPNLNLQGGTAQYIAPVDTDSDGAQQLDIAPDDIQNSSHTYSFSSQDQAPAPGLRLASSANYNCN